MPLAEAKIVSTLPVNVDGTSCAFLLIGDIRKTGDATTTISLETLRPGSGQLTDPQRWVPPDTHITTSIVQPFGMKGVTLTELSAGAEVAFIGDTHRVDAWLAAKVELGDLTLNAAALVQDGSAYLVLVQIGKDQPLYLSQLLTTCFDVDPDGFVGQVTDNFGFSHGQFYYLSPAAAGADAKTRQLLTDKCGITIAGKAAAGLLAGYYLQSRFIVFDHTLDAQLAVTKPAAAPQRPAIAARSDIAMRAYMDADGLNALDFGFAKITKLGVEMTVTYGQSATAAPDRIFAFHCGLTFLDAQLEITAGYDQGRSLFIASMGQLPSPLNFVHGLDCSWNKEKLIGALHLNANFAGADFDPVVRFRWQKNGDPAFAITGIDNFDTLPGLKALDWANRLMQGFSHSSGCEKILGDWLGCEVTFTPHLKVDSVTWEGDKNRLKLPISLHYDIKMVMDTHAGGDIDFDLYVTAPRDGLKGLPEAFLTSLLDDDNAPRIAVAMLKQKGTYEVIMAQAIAKGGAAAAARFVCRTMERVVSEIVKILAWLFGFGASERRAKEKQATEDIIAAVDPFLTEIGNRVAEVKAQIEPSNLSLSLDDHSDLAASWTGGSREGLDGTINYVFYLQFLTAPGGDVVINPQPQTVTTYGLPWDDASKAIHAAQVCGKITGLCLMPTEAAKQLRSAMTQLDELDDKSAKDYVAKVQAKLAELDGYSTNGIISDWCTTTLPPNTMPRGLGTARLDVNLVLA